MTANLFAALPEELAYLRSIASGKNILEIGTFAGVSALAFVEGGANLVVTIDCYDSGKMRGDAKREYGRNLGDAVRLLQQTFVTLHKFTNPIIIAGHTPESLSVLRDNFFDVIFIDGDHSYDGVRDDFYAALPKCRVGGLIVFHDYSDETLGWVKVKGFVDSELSNYQHSVVVGSLCVLVKR